MQTLADHLEELPALAAVHSAGAGAPAGAAANNLGAAAALPLLVQQLASQGVPGARIGKDLIDPFETFGFYGGADFTRHPEHAALALRHLGYLAGAEWAAALAAAEARGAALACVDAPLRQQEGWARRLADGFEVRQEQLGQLQLLKLLRGNESLLAPGAAAWDQQLALHYAADVDAAAGAAAAAAAGGSVGGGGDAAAAEAAAALAEAQALQLLAFKASRATAAALLAPAEVPGVLERLAQLQPLKWRHMALREAHLAWQLRELCTPRSGAGGSSAGSPSGAGGAAGRGRVVVALLGRHHVLGVERVWRDGGSPLWRDRMPPAGAASSSSSSSGSESSDKAADLVQERLV